MSYQNPQVNQSYRSMRFQSNSFNHHLILIILVLVMSDHYFNVHRFQEIRQICFLLLYHPNNVICVDTSICTSKPCTSLGLLFEQVVCVVLFPLFLNPFLFLLLGLWEFAPHFIDNNSFLFLFLFPQLFLFLHNLTLDLLIFKLLLLLKLDKVIFKSIHEGLNVFIWSQLTTVTNLLSAEWALLFTQSIVGFNAVVTETMQTAFVNNWIVYHFLTNWTCQILGNTSHKILAYHVVQN